MGQYDAILAREMEAELMSTLIEKLRERVAQNVDNCDVVTWSSIERIVAELERDLKACNGDRETNIVAAVRAEKDLARVTVERDTARKLAREWLYSARQARWHIFGPRDGVDYEAGLAAIAAVEPPYGKLPLTVADYEAQGLLMAVEGEPLQGEVTR